MNLPRTAACAGVIGALLLSAVAGRQLFAQVSEATPAPPEAKPATPAPSLDLEPIPAKEAPKKAVESAPVAAPAAVVPAEQKSPPPAPADAAPVAKAPKVSEAEKKRAFIAKKTVATPTKRARAKRTAAKTSSAPRTATSAERKAKPTPMVVSPEPVEAVSPAVAGAPSRDSRKVAKALFPINVVPNMVSSTLGYLGNPLWTSMRGEGVDRHWPVAVIGSPVLGPMTGIVNAAEGYYFWENWPPRVTRSDSLQDQFPRPHTPPPAPRRKAAR